MIGIFYRWNASEQLTCSSSEREELLDGRYILQENLCSESLESFIKAENGKVLVYQIDDGCEPVTYELSLENLKKTGGNFKCDQCSSTFHQNRYLLLHKKHGVCRGGQEKAAENIRCISEEIKTRKKRQCSFCKLIFSSKPDLRRHLYLDHEMVEAGYMCELCGKIFSNYQLFWKHKLTHSEERPFHCDLCNKNFKTRRHLKCHVKIHGMGNDYGNKKFSCDKCDKSLTKEKFLEAHMRQHSGDLKYQCKDCGRRFSSSVGVNIHRSNKTKACTLLSCDLCNKKFRPEEDSCDHLKKEKSQKHAYVPRCKREKKKSCPICGKMFLFNSEVKLHLAVSHSDEKKFLCEECGKGFKTRKCFKLHERIHLDRRPYPCNFCVKKFRTFNQLKTHVRTHTGEKPYECLVCSRGFAQNGDMKKHLLKIHDMVFKKIKD